MDERLDEVLADLCISGATWKLSSGQPAVPIQLRRTELHPLAKGWHEFIIHSLVPTGNKLEITITRAILIHCIMRGQEVRAEDIIADNIAVIAQGLPNKGNLAFPSTIYKLYKDVGVPLREFRRTSRIPEVVTSWLREWNQQGFLGIYHNHNMKMMMKMMMKMNQCLKRGEAMMKKRNNSSHNKTNSHHNKDFWIFSQDMKANTMRTSKKSQADYMEEVKQIKEKQEEILTNNQRFQSQVRQEQERLTKEIQEVRKSQITQTLANNNKLEIEKNKQLAMERQGRDIVEMRKQLNLWTRNTSAREAYTCWAH
ncbi:hypothetical protein PIB30_081285 [Stylosanthes scabra]|uniref:Putative plant transposon protein domain-containing protein n=1 Tax=Stylosanthes scabra TaxID=79078 RepID=A0ABU6UUA0_9FABA|nr:hypothetical protein [Stylosanthes scabra]